MLASLKATLPWIVPGTIAALLCCWTFVARQAGRDAVKNSHMRVPTDAQADPAREPLHDESISPPNAPPHGPSIDQALGQLESELRRATHIADPDERRGVLTAACLRWMEFDPVDALRMTRALGLDRNTDSAREDIVQKWATADFTAALAWTAREPAGETRDRLWARLVFIRAQTKPYEAVELATSRIPPGAIRAEAVICAIHQWALHDPAGARTWIDGSAGELRDRARTELAGAAGTRLTAGEPPR